MKTLVRISLFIICLFKVQITFSVPVSNELVQSSPYHIRYTDSVNTKKVEGKFGRKSSLRKKIVLAILKSKLNKLAFEKSGSKKGQASMTLGIIAIGGFLLGTLIFGPLILISLPLGILALIFGYQAKKLNPEDKKAKTGIVLGWVAIGLFLLIAALIAVVIASEGFII